MLREKFKGCPTCGGELYWDNDEGCVSCVAPGTCTWWSYYDELEKL